MTNKERILAKVKIAKLQKSIDNRLSLVNEMEILNAKAKGLIKAIEPIIKKISNRQSKLAELKKKEDQLLKELEQLGLSMDDVLELPN